MVLRDELLAGSLSRLDYDGEATAVVHAARKKAAVAILVYANVKIARSKVRSRMGAYPSAKIGFAFNNRNEWRNLVVTADAVELYLVSSGVHLGPCSTIQYSVQAAPHWGAWFSCGVERS